MSANASQVSARWRPADAGDDEAIVAMCLALNTEDPGVRLVPEHHVRRTLGALREEPWRGCAVVLAIDQACCGYALLIRFWSNERGGEVCVIDELYLLPAHRGQGHGSRLLDGLARGELPWARSAVALTLETTPANARAVRLYERLGFKRGNTVMTKWKVR
jgi:ribosomal protein S18 acetylase RimI-like enzyme